MKKQFFIFSLAFFTSLLSADENKNQLDQTADIVFRFAVGSDSHYGSDIPTDPPDGNAQSVTNFVDWMNREKNDSRLDLVFLNGDITMNPRTGWNGPGLNYPIDQGGFVESHFILGRGFANRFIRIRNTNRIPLLGVAQNIKPAIML